MKRGVISGPRRFHASGARRENVLDLLERRGLVNQIAGSRDALSHLLDSKRASIYAGIDPTAPSLHLGHLLPLMVLFWLRRHGQNVVTLIGGATAQVGDPSGRLTSRAKTAKDRQQSNVERMTSQIESMWHNNHEYSRRRSLIADSGKSSILNNDLWLKGLSILEFLRVLGSGTRVGTMLGRDTVRNKMEKGDGMSFAEFTYPLLQGYDWWYMFKRTGVRVQVGGADQYGNIIAGMDAVRYLAQNTARGYTEWLDEDGRLKDELAPIGLTVPLLTTSSGEKFGKSAGNAVWLDPSMTSSFDLYGFLLRAPDADVERYLNLLTLVSDEAIANVMSKQTADPSKRVAQHLLAREVLELVHGLSAAEKTEAEHQAMRTPTLRVIADTATTDYNRIELPKALVVDLPVTTVLHNAGLASSNSAARRMIAGGGVYIAGKPANGKGEELDFVQVGNGEAVQTPQLIDGTLVFRLGKWKVRVVKVVEEFERGREEAISDVIESFR